MVLGLLAAGSSGALAWSARGLFADWVVTLGAVLAFIGLIAVLAFIAGVVQFGRVPQQRAFFDGLIDALREAAVVTDGQGRAVYANGQFLKLASDAGASRLVVLENLYAG